MAPKNIRLDDPESDTGTCISYVFLYMILQFFRNLYPLDFSNFRNEMKVRETREKLDDSNILQGSSSEVDRFACFVVVTVVAIRTSSFFTAAPIQHHYLLAKASVEVLSKR